MQVSNSPESSDITSPDFSSLSPVDLLKELEVLVNETEQSPRLSKRQIKEIAKACVEALSKHGTITNTLLAFLKETYEPVTSTPTLQTPDDRPKILSSDKPPSSAPARKRMTLQQLHGYLGFCQINNWDVIHDIAQPNIDIIKTGEKVLELGDVANIKKSRKNNIPIQRPLNFMDTVHMDIGYGDCLAVGGAQYCVLFVDRSVRKHFVYPLRSLNHEEIIGCLDSLVVDAGCAPRRILTDFDNKILDGRVTKWFQFHKVKVQAAPPGRQNQNGLVECAWQTSCNMARSYITDMRMPREYWYWAIRHSFQVMDYLPVTVNGLSTTPFELTYGVKPDYRVLFRLFSTGYFCHEKDGTRKRDGIAEAKTMQGIAIGRCRKSDGMLFYCPHTREIYTSADYKLDEGASTATLFNLRYDGGIFVGLYNSGDKTQATEPYPEGTSIIWVTKIGSKKVRMRGTVISVPLPSDDTALPDNSHLEATYKIKWVDGCIYSVPPAMMDDIVDFPDLTKRHNFTFPAWLQTNQKVMYLRDGEYIKGLM